MVLQMPTYHAHLRLIRHRPTWRPDTHELARRLSCTTAWNQRVPLYRHDGLPRVLRSLYPEGDTVCPTYWSIRRAVWWGDTVETQVSVAPGAHGLVTTPGATRFYRSLGEFLSARARPAGGWRTAGVAAAGGPGL